MATKKPPVGKQAPTPKRTVKPVDEDAVAPSVVESYIKKFKTVGPSDKDRLSTEAIDWFRKIVPKRNKLNQNAFLAGAEYNKKSGTEKTQLLGKLYLYQYAAENAGDAELGIYDQYPLVFFFNSTRTKDGKFLLWGLNLHYLPPRERMYLLLALLKQRSTKETRPGMRLRLSWRIIKAITKSSLYEPAVHAYRVDRVVTRLTEIPATDWSIVVFLQLAKWSPVRGGGHPSKHYAKAINRRAKAK